MIEEKTLESINPQQTKQTAFYDHQTIINRSTNDIKKSEIIRQNWNNFGVPKASEYLLVTDNIDELLNVIHFKKIVTVKPTFTKNNKIFIHESSSFPALLLNRLDIDLKRTVQIDKADYIVINPHIVISKDIGNIYLYAPKPNTTDTMIFISNIWSYADSEEINKNKYISVQENFKSKMNVDLKYCLKISKRVYNLYKQSQKQSKFISTLDLVSYVNSKLPVLSEDEYANISNMITSKDHESVVAGYNLLQYVNFSNKIVELITDLTNNDKIELLTTTAAQYIYNILGTDMSTIYTYQYRPFKDKLNFRIEMSKNSLIPNDVRNRVLKALQKDLLTEITDKYSEQLETLQIKLVVEDTIIDENRETEISDREMETE